MSDFDRGFAAAESDLVEGWVSIKYPDSVIRNACIMNAGESEAFADGYLASVARARAAARDNR